jgi:hypothetical protein
MSHVESSNINTTSINLYDFEDLKVMFKEE